MIMFVTLISYLIQVHVYAQSNDSQSIPAIQSLTSSSAISTHGKDGSTSTESSINIEAQNSISTTSSYAYIPDQLAENSSFFELKFYYFINFINIILRKTRQYIRW